MTESKPHTYEDFTRRVFDMTDYSCVWVMQVYGGLTFSGLAGHFDIDFSGLTRAFDTI